MRDEPELSLILPVYNERESISSVISEWVKGLKAQQIRGEIIVCEDGSTDGTKELLSSIKRRYGLVLNQAGGRRGYGGAVIDGIKSARGKYLLCIDSDGQCDPGDLSKFWERRDNLKVIMGWRRNRQDQISRLIFSRSFGAFFKLLFPTPIHDPSAPFVLFPRNLILPHLNLLTYLKEGFWWGFVGMCVKRKIAILEIPVNHRVRSAGNTRVYNAQKMPGIILRNLWGLIRLRNSE